MVKKMKNCLKENSLLMSNEGGLWSFVGFPFFLDLSTAFKWRTGCWFSDRLRNGWLIAKLEKMREIGGEASGLL